MSSSQGATSSSATSTRACTRSIALVRIANRAVPWVRAGRHGPCENIAYLRCEGNFHPKQERPGLLRSPGVLVLHPAECVLCDNRRHAFDDGKTLASQTALFA